MPLVARSIHCDVEEISSPPAIDLKHVSGPIVFASVTRDCQSAIGYWDAGKRDHVPISLNIIMYLAVCGRSRPLPANVAAMLPDH